MEQRRIIWIVAAVGIFLTVVLLASRMMYHGGEKTILASNKGEATSRTAQLNKTDASGWTGNDAEVDGALPSPLTSDVQVNDMTVVAKNATVFAIERKYPDDKYTMKSNENSLATIKDNSIIDERIDLNTIGGKAVAQDEEEFRSMYTGNKDASTAVPSTKSETKGEGAKTTPVATAPVKKATPTVKKEVSENSTVVAKTSTAKAATKSAPKATPKKDDTASSDWWVQAASFTSLKYADDARTLLGQNKINADVFTYKDSLGRVFYRVRVGPYLTKSEAEYWKSRIGQIDTFTDTQSFVTRG